MNKLNFALTILIYSNICVIGLSYGDTAVW